MYLPGLSVGCNYNVEQKSAGAPAVPLLMDAVKDTISGLTSEEVSERVSAGKVNVTETNTGKTEGQIVRDNICTYFNAIFAVLAVLLIISGNYNDLTFIAVIVINTAIGIIQQISSKRTIDKLTLLTVSDYEAVRDGAKAKVKADRLVQDDCIFLSSGQQIPADAVVLSGSAHVNESLLTGEADEIEKKKGDTLLSGSFVVSGKCLVRLTKVGAESYAARLSAKAKSAGEKQSEMVRSIDAIIKVAGILIIPIGAILFAQSMLANGNTFSESVRSAVGAVIGMIPEGLYLLLTVALAMSAAKLAAQHVMLHDMRSMEALARVDVICVDKTGTITDAVMKVTEVFGVGSGSTSDYEGTLKAYMTSVPDNNATAEALQTYYSEKVFSTPFNPIKVTPFDSKNKYSEIQTADGNYRLGAPEYVADAASLEAEKERLTTLKNQGSRVMAFAKDEKALLFIAIENHIRDNAPATFEFFRNQGVAVKVISGDNPETVSKIAQRAKIAHADSYIDMSGIKPGSVELHEAAEKYTVFGRVTPEQKKALVKAIRAGGKKVAMTGDGVNDILAMKEADCSIAMGSGCEAAANAAQVVLLDSDFSHMKQIVSEGRRNINNLTRSATLFLYKNLFSLFLAIFSIASFMSYPLTASQISLISFFNIGVPAFFLAFEENTKKQKDHFIRTVLLSAMPAALTSFVFIAGMVIFGQVFKISSADVGIASTFLLAIVGFMILVEISHPLNQYRMTVIIGCIAGMIVAALLFPNLFGLDVVSTQCVMLFVVFALAEDTVMRWLTRLFKLRPPKRKKSSQEKQKGKKAA